MRPTSANFEFLRTHSDQLYKLAALAEGYFRTDPNTTLMKLRQFVEQMAKDVAARNGLLQETSPKFSDLLSDLRRSGRMPRQVLDLFHYVRTRG